MKIRIVTPAPPGSRKGNRVTALRWAGLLRELGHRVSVAEQYDGQACHVLVALHARRNAAAVQRCRQEWPSLPIVLALTGTDLYGDIHTSEEARRALEMASRLIVLQPQGLAELPEHLRSKTRVIFQSARRPPRPVPALKKVFEVCVLGHLRPVKDPLRTALAARLLPASSKIRVTHVGAALNEEAAERARAEAALNPRYRWLGELPRWKALRILARSRMMALTSTMEGGANVVSEAMAAGVPIVTSRIPGSVGILGEDYPGCFPVGDTAALAGLLARLESDAEFYASLKAWCRRLRPLVDPTRERRSWASVLAELSGGGTGAAWRCPGEVR